MSESRIHFRYHAARRRTIAGLQHERSRKAAHGAQAGGTGRGHSGGRLSDRFARAISKPCDAVSREFPVGAVAALARCCTLDVERAAESLEHAAPPAHPHLHRHQRHPSEVQAEEDRASRFSTKPWPPWSWPARYVDDVEFSAEDGARTDPDYLEQVSKAVVAAGARTVNIPDTVGYSDAAGIRRADRRALPRALGDCAIVSVHCHDDLGLAVANSLAAVRRARGRSSAPSTASASAPATVRSKRS